MMKAHNIFLGTQTKVQHVIYNKMANEAKEVSETIDNPTYTTNAMTEMLALGILWTMKGPFVIMDRLTPANEKRGIVSIGAYKRHFLIF